MEKIREPYILRKGKLEFMVIGPWSNRDRILVRSEDAGTELSGFNRSRGDLISNSETGYRASLLIAKGLFPNRFLRIVKSQLITDMSLEQDSSRMSYMYFVWRGNAPEDLKTEQLFAHAAEKLQIAIRNVSELDEIELILAPVILRCVANETRSRRIWIRILEVTIVYLVLLVFAFLLLYLYTMYRDLVRHTWDRPSESVSSHL